MKHLFVLGLFLFSACTYNGKSGAERQHIYEEERQKQQAQELNRVNPSPGIPSTEQGQPF